MVRGPDQQEEVSKPEAGSQHVGRSAAQSRVLLFLFAEWQPHTHGGGCEQAVVRSWQRSKQRSLATASNIVFAGFFQIGQGLCVQNSYWVLQAAFLLGPAGSCAVMAEIQTTQPSNRFEHRVRGLLPNWTRALRPKFLLGTSGSILTGDFRQHL